MSKGFGTACISGAVFLLVISLGIQSGLAASKQESVEKAKQEWEGVHKETEVGFL